MIHRSLLKIHRYCTNMYFRYRKVFYTMHDGSITYWPVYDYIFISVIIHGLWSYWMWNFPMSPHVRLLVDLSVCRYVIIFLKKAGRLHFHARSTCFRNTTFCLFDKVSIFLFYQLPSVKRLALIKRRKREKTSIYVFCLQNEKEKL